MNNERFLEFTQLGKTYDTPQGPAVIITDFTLHIRQGEFICIIGQSGCGKSTILSMVMGLNEPTMGGVILAGREINGPGTDRGVVFQSPALLPWYTARENVLLAVEQVHGLVAAALELNSDITAHRGRGHTQDLNPLGRRGRSVLRDADEARQQKRGESRCRRSARPLGLDFGK